MSERTLIGKDGIYLISCRSPGTKAGIYVNGRPEAVAEMPSAPAVVNAQVELRQGDIVTFVPNPERASMHYLAPMANPFTPFIRQVREALNV